ncbi:MAG: DUF4136 domain-containing protein [Thermoanaerobaculia bacterium]
MRLEVDSRQALAVSIAACLFLLAAGAAAKDSGVKFERDADFSKYAKYGWSEPAKKPESSPLAVGGTLDTKVRNAIDRQLKAQGFEPAIDDDPDFLISFDGAMESVTDFDGLRRDIAPGVAWVIEGSVNSYNRGTLIISVRDGDSEKIVWSAWTTEKVKDPANPGKQVDRAVKKLLKRFPPR